MAVCSNCNSEVTRVRSILRGNVFKDECPVCTPQSFEKQADPSTKKMWMGYEYMPKKYLKKEDKDGPIYVAKDELVQDTEDQIAKGCTDENELYYKTVAKKRKERRTEPLVEGTVEFQHIKRKADELVASAIRQAEEGLREAQKAQDESFVKTILPIEYVN